MGRAVLSLRWQHESTHARGFFRRAHPRDRRAVRSRGSTSRCACGPRSPKSARASCGTVTATPSPPANRPGQPRRAGDLAAQHRRRTRRRRLHRGPRRASDDDRPGDPRGRRLRLTGGSLANAVVIATHRGALRNREAALPLENERLAAGPNSGLPRARSLVRGSLVARRSLTSVRRRANDHNARGFQLDHRTSKGRP